MDVMRQWSPFGTGNGIGRKDAQAPTIPGRLAFGAPDAVRPVGGDARSGLMGIRSPVTWLPRTSGIAAGLPRPDIVGKGLPTYGGETAWMSFASIRDHGPGGSGRALVQGRVIGAA